MSLWSTSLADPLEAEGVLLFNVDEELEDTVEIVGLVEDVTGTMDARDTSGALPSDQGPLSSLFICIPMLMTMFVPLVEESVMPFWLMSITL